MHCFNSHASIIIIFWVNNLIQIDKYENKQCASVHQWVYCAHNAMHVCVYWPKYWIQGTAPILLMLTHCDTVMTYYNRAIVYVITNTCASALKSQTICCLKSSFLHSTTCFHRLFCSTMSFQLLQDNQMNGIRCTRHVWRTIRLHLCVAVETTAGDAEEKLMVL